MAARKKSKVRASVKHGDTGKRIFEQIEQLTANGGMNRTAAFKQLASTSGRQVGAVAAAYYRVARQRGAALRPRSAGKATAGRGSSRIAAALRALEAAVQEQEHELARLRDENRRFQQLRRLLKA